MGITRYVFSLMMDVFHPTRGVLALTRDVLSPSRWILDLTRGILIPTRGWGGLRSNKGCLESNGGGGVLFLGRMKDGLSPAKGA